MCRVYQLTHAREGVRAAPVEPVAARALASARFEVIFGAWRIPRLTTAFFALSAKPVIARAATIIIITAGDAAEISAYHTSGRALEVAICCRGALAEFELRVTLAGWINTAT